MYPIPKVRSIKIKLLFLFIVFIVAINLMFSFLGVKLIGNAVIKQAQDKVKHDLASAWLVYNETLNHVKEIIVYTARREGIVEVMHKGDRNTLSNYLSNIKNEYKFGFLSVTDKNGKVIIRVGKHKVIGDYKSADEIVSRALNKEIAAGTQILPASELMKETPELAGKSFIRLVPTLKAVPTKETELVDGMALKSAAPILGKDGKLLGVIYGGVLLNRNFEIVDRIKDTVFKGIKYKGKDSGTATIFQKDVRITTNVKDDKGERAIGTRIAEEVYKKVLIQGEAWIDRAFVVNDWYITAYEPIKNINGNIIGILYVGMLESPYKEIKAKLLLSYFRISVLVLLIFTVFAFFIANTIVKPLKHMAISAEKIANGNLDIEVEASSGDEIGLLADSFNRMTSNLKKSYKELTEFNKMLEQKVKERTEELKKAQDYLIQSEKLTSLGQMAAGVAHEVNNPLSGVLVYIKFMLKKLSGNSLKTEETVDYLQKMDVEITRCTRIIRNLLDFSRQSTPSLRMTDVNEIILQTLSMVEHQAQMVNVKIIKELGQNLPDIMADGEQLQQVFTNLILNGIQAMEEKGSGNGADGAPPEGVPGSLIIRTASCVLKELEKEIKSIKIEVIDSGTGIARENLQKLFTPFFTTKKKSKGVGLGLAVVYGIIERHKGKIEVESEPGKGTTFTVYLKEDSDE
jgi:two-component system NtrC family sensor kinase